MAFSTRFLVLWMVFFILQNCDSDPQAEALSQRWAKHDWSQNRPEILVDINQDGIKERALIGSDEKTIVVAVFHEENVNIIDFVEIFTNKPSQ